MSIIVLSRDYGNNPSLVRMVSTDDLSTISTAGYLAAQANNIIALNGGPFQWQPSDFILCYYDVSPPYYTGGSFEFFSLNNDFDTLVAFSNPSSGTVTDINTNDGVTGGPITLTGTIGLADIPDITILSNISGGVTFPTPNTLTDILDNCIGGVQGNILYRGATEWSVLSPGTTGTILQSGGAGGDPNWTLATYPLTTNANEILYSIANNSIIGLATIADGVLITDALGIPSISTTLPAGLTIPGYEPTITPAALTKVDDTNVTLTLGGTPTTALLQATSLTLGWTGQLGLTRGGTAASLTASNGGIVYSTASALAILAGTATANQVLLSGSSTTPAWSTATYPATTTINQILYSSAANTVTGIATVNSAGLLTNGSGVPAWVAATGTGAPVLATSPTLTTPTIGAATATSVTFSPTTGGIVGTTTNDNADAGKVGEFVSSTITSNTVSFVTTVSKDLTSISLTAGDWDVYGNIYFSVSAGSSHLSCWVSTTSATAPDGSLIANLAATTAILLSSGLIAPYRRISLSGTTTVYITGNATFSAGTVTGGGGIYARRVR